MLSRPLVCVLSENLFLFWCVRLRWVEEHNYVIFSSLYPYVIISQVWVTFWIRISGTSQHGNLPCTSWHLRGSESGERQRTYLTTSMWLTLLLYVDHSEYRTLDPALATSFIIPFDMGVHSFIGELLACNGVMFRWISVKVLCSITFLRFLSAHDVCLNNNLPKLK